MTNIHSNIEAAKVIAARLIKRNQAAATAEKKRDACFYRFLESVHELDTRLRKMSREDAVKELKGKKLPTNRDSAMFAVKLAHPRLDSGLHSKYAAVLRFIRQRKKSGQSVRSFVRKNGDIKGCVEQERQLRHGPQGRHGLRKSEKK